MVNFKIIARTALCALASKICHGSSHKTSIALKYISAHVNCVITHGLDCIKLVPPPGVEPGPCLLKRELR